MLQPKSKSEGSPSLKFLPGDVPSNIGSSEPDEGPASMQPDTKGTITTVPPPTNNDVPPNIGTSEPDTGPESQNEDQGNQIVKNLTAHLDQLPTNDKQFLAEHMTPEFVRAIGLINGPEVAGYLNQFVDPNKVLVPVPRQIAEQYLAKQQQEKATAAPQPQQPAQGAPAMSPPQPTAPVAPPSPQGMPQQSGMMQPS